MRNQVHYIVGVYKIEAKLRMKFLPISGAIRPCNGLRQGNCELSTAVIQLIKVKYKILGVLHYSPQNQIIWCKFKKKISYRAIKKNIIIFIEKIRRGSSKKKLF